jgi:uncharacterized membrane protein
MRTSGMAKNFFNSEEQKLIIDAIRAAEQHTNGEIRVHIEPTFTGDVYVRAQQVFDELKMFETEARNGVLFYVAYEKHQLAILGDKGIHDKVGQDFWDHEKQLLIEHFKRNAFAEGLCKAIALAGEKLQTYFPKTAGNPDELSNDISFGNPSAHE